MRPVLSESARCSHEVRSPAHQNVSSLRSLRNTENVHVGPYTWGVQVVRYPNFFLGNGSR